MDQIVAQGIHQSPPDKLVEIRLQSTAQNLTLKIPTDERKSHSGRERTRAEVPRQGLEDSSLDRNTDVFRERVAFIQRAPISKGSVRVVEKVVQKDPLNSLMWNTGCLADLLHRP